MRSFCKNNSINTLRLRCAKKRRERFLAQQRRRIKNTTPTILCNNCIGGLIYSDLGLEFRSPTVNVLFHADDYFRFLNNVEAYLASDMTEVFEDGISYPIGVLKNGNEEVRVRFLHETNFSVAKATWQRRAARVDLDNIYVIFEYAKKLHPTNRYYKAFKQLKWKHKRMLTIPWRVIDRELVFMPVYWRNYQSGRVLQLRSKYKAKRHLDAFDYVSFLNKR